MKKLSLSRQTMRLLTPDGMSDMHGGTSTLISFANPCQPSIGPAATVIECVTARCRTQ